MRSSQYPKEWFDADSGQILATGIDSDIQAIALENAGMEFMNDKGIGINVNRANLPRKPSETGYTVSNPGCVYYNPLNKGITAEEYREHYVSYYSLSKDGGLKVKGTDKRSMGTDAWSMGTDAWSMGTDAWSMGTDKRSMGTDAVSMGTAKKVSTPDRSSRSSKGGSVPKDAHKTPQQKAETIKVWCDMETREHPKNPYGVITLWVEITGKSMNGNVAKKVFDCL